MPGGVIVALTDGEESLAHYLDLLRERGHRVLATPRNYEAALFAARHAAMAVVARGPALPRDADDFLRRLAELEPRPFIIVTAPAPHRPLPEGSVADLLIPEPYRYSDLLEAVGFAAQRERTRTPVGESPSLVAAAGSEDAAWARLFAESRRLTELERNRDELLTVALHSFLDLAAAERGSIMLLDAEQRTLSLVRHHGFPEGFTDPGPQPIGDTPAGRAVASGEPELGRDAVAVGPRRYRGRSYLVLPIRNRKVVLGVVNLTDRHGGEAFTDQDLALGSRLASHLAVNLVNSRKLEDLGRMAVVDPLTGLFNRRYFDRQVGVELERARRHGRQVTLALIDIDRFKIINDLSGYAAGDQVLRHVAAVLRGCFREVDIVTRWGGDEFAVLLPDTGAGDDESPAISSVDRVRLAVEKARLAERVPGIEGRVTISVGVATFPEDGEDHERLFSHANLGLQRAKQSGTNRVCRGTDRHEPWSASRPGDGAHAP